MHELSGGMRQRVVARAGAGLAQHDEPGLLLMDEPFAALDAHHPRRAARASCCESGEATGTTILFVTHNVREAVRLAQRVVLLSSRPGTVVREWDVPELGAPEREVLHDEITARLRQVITSHAA